MVKYIFSFVLICFFSFSYANLGIKKTYKNGKVKILETGDRVRITCPSDKLENVKTKKDFIGISGKIIGIKSTSIILKTNRKIELELTIDDITAIEKNSALGSIASFVGTYAVIGVGSMYFLNQADINSAFIPLTGAIAVIPSIAISSSLFYPVKAKRKVDKDYKIEITHR